MTLPTVRTKGGGRRGACRSMIRTIKNSRPLFVLLRESTPYFPTRTVQPNFIRYAHLSDHNMEFQKTTPKQIIYIIRNWKIKSKAKNWLEAHMGRLPSPSPQPEPKFCVSPKPPSPHHSKLANQQRSGQNKGFWAADRRTDCFCTYFPNFK